jgi:hypothetical protein
VLAQDTVVLAQGTAELARDTVVLAQGTAELALGIVVLALGIVVLAPGTAELAQGTAEPAQDIVESVRGKFARARDTESELRLQTGACRRWPVRGCRCETQLRIHCPCSCRFPFLASLCVEL